MKSERLAREGVMQSRDRDLALNYAIAELRLSIAFITLHLLEIKAGFREDQPRGSNGRWSGGAGTVIVTRKDKTGDSKIDRYTDTIVDVVKEIVETTDPGRAPCTELSFTQKLQHGCEN